SAQATREQRPTERCLAGCKGLLLWIIEHHLRTAVSRQKAYFFGHIQSKATMIVAPVAQVEITGVLARQRTMPDKRADRVGAFCFRMNHPTRVEWRTRCFDGRRGTRERR